MHPLRNKELQQQKAKVEEHRQTGIHGLYQFDPPCRGEPGCDLVGVFLDLIARLI